MTMAITDLFSKRRKKQRGETPDVYIYDALSNTLRVQIIQIWLDVLGEPNHYTGVFQRSASNSYEYVVKVLRHEYGVFELPDKTNTFGKSYFEELCNIFLQEKDVEKVLDVVELTFHVIDSMTRNVQYLGHYDALERADKAIDELNYRFNGHGIGYQFIPPRIIRADSEFIHSEVVKPALKLLNKKHYSGAQQEFLKAHEHYRKGNAKEALNDCLKAFESAMKSICDKRKWNYDKNSTARPLIQACFENGLIPEFWLQHYTSLQSLLESSVPTGRNKLSGHGQGTHPVSVPNCLVAYMLHMTASALVFLAEAENNLR